MSVFFNENEWMWKENQTDNFPVAQYGAKSFMWTDALYNGNFVNALSNNHGQTFCREEVIKYLQGFRAEKSHFNSFELEINGLRLRDKFVFENQILEKDERGFGVHTISLSDPDMKIRVRVKTRLDGSAFLVRWLEIENAGREKVAVTGLYPMCGILYREVMTNTFNGQNFRPESYVASFSDNNYLGEGEIKWFKIPKATLKFAHERPVFNPPTYFLKNDNSCQITVISIETSMMPRAEFTKCGDYTWARHVTNADYLHFKAGVDRCALPRFLEPGQTVVSAKVHIGQVWGDLDDASNELFDHIRLSVKPARNQPITHPVAYTHGCYSDCHQQNKQMLIKAVDNAAAIGAEMFMVDAGWFGSEKGDWYTQRGDWYETPSLKGGLKDVFDYAHKKGMMCGLWMEAEGCDLSSELAKTHPEWLIQAYGRKMPTLNLLIPEVREYVYNSICGVIDKYNLDLFRIDGGLKEPSERYTESGYEGTSWEYYEYLYEIIDKVRKKYPSLYFENCSGGGGRSDLGIMSRFDWMQATDLFAPITQLRVIYGLSRAMCPEQLLSIPALVHNGDPDLLARTTIFGHIETTDIADNYLRMNPVAKAAWLKAIDLYKKQIRPIIDTCNVYHHTPFEDYTKRGEWLVLEYASKDKSKSIVGAFRLEDANESEYVVKPRGISCEGEYEAYLDNTGDKFTVSGYELNQKGFTVKLSGKTTSEIAVFTRK